MAAMAVSEPQSTVAELGTLAAALRPGYKSYQQKDLYKPAYEALVVWMRENAYVNMADASRALGVAIEAFGSGLVARVAALKAEEARIAGEAVKSHPDFKEVPAELQQAFRGLGIDVLQHRGC